MSDKQFFTNKDNFLSPKEIFESLAVDGAKDLNISKEYNEGFYGFGVALTPSSCYELSLMEKDKRRSFLKELYGK